MVGVAKILGDGRGRGHDSLDNRALEGACAGLLEPYNLRQSLLRVFLVARVSCQSGLDQRTQAVAGEAAWCQGPDLVHLAMGLGC